jgi:hypothetical protein
MIAVTHKMSDLERKWGKNSGCCTNGGETRVKNVPVNYGR